MNNIIRTISVISLISIGWSACNERTEANGDEAPAFSQTAADSTLKAANDRFYAALNDNFTGNTRPLIDIWSHTEEVSDQGPFGARLDGWKAVEEEFLKEGAMKLGGKVVCKDLIVRAGREFGYTACVEEGVNMSADGKPVVVRFRATNIFKMENGAWKMVHHHTDISKPLQEATAFHNDEPER